MSDVWNKLQATAIGTWDRAYDTLMSRLPEAALAILLVGVGLLVAAALYFATLRIMAFFAIDKLAAKTPLQRMLRGAGITRNVSDIFAFLIFWLIVFITLVFAADVLELEQVSNTLAVVTLFIPQLIAAFLIMVFGMLLARFLQIFVEQSLQRAEIRIANLMGKIVYVIVIIVAIQLVVEQLGFDLSFLTTNVLIFLCVIFVVGGLVAVTVCRTLLENAIACYQLRQQLSVGQNVNIGNTQGRIVRFALAHVILDTSSGETAVPALSFFTSAYTFQNTHGHGN